MANQIQSCPLCKRESTYSYSSLRENTVKNIKCSRCKKLVLEEGIEDDLYSYLQQSKDKIIAMAETVKTNQVLYFCWNDKVKNSAGKSEIVISVMDTNLL